MNSDDKRLDIGVNVISELKNKGYTEKEIEVILLKTLKTILAEKNISEYIIKELKLLEGEGLFDKI